MCLTIPKKVISVREGIIKIMSFNDRKEQEAKTIIKVKKGEWVLTQNGIIISKLTSRQASEICNLFNKK
jgi:hydrogenase maturation factor